MLQKIIYNIVLLLAVLFNVSCSFPNLNGISIKQAKDNINIIKEYNKKNNITEEKIIEPKYDVTYDEFKNTYFLKQQDYIHKTEPMNLYAVQRENNKYMRAIFKYVGNDWIFYNKIYLINDDGNKLILNVNNYKKYKEVLDNSEVMEYIDIYLDKVKKIKLLKLLNTKKQVKLRFEGNNFYKDYTLNSYAVLKNKEFLSIFDLEYKILKKLKKIPISKTKENLNLYQKLLSMFPYNKKYIKKVNFYKSSKK